MPRARSTTRPGTSVRFPLDDLDDYRILAGLFLRPKPVSGLLVELTMEIIEYFVPDDRQNVGLKGGGLIQDIQASAARVSPCQRIASRRFRTLPNSATQAVWMGFTANQTRKLLEVANSLSWPQGKLVQQAVRDAMVLASSDGTTTEVPVLAKFYWGLKLFEQEATSDLILQINGFLEKWKRDRKDREIPSEEEPPHPVTVVGLDLIGKSDPRSDDATKEK